VDNSAVDNLEKQILKKLEAVRVELDDQITDTQNKLLILEDKVNSIPEPV
jgi:hypothetical protein